MNIRFCLTIQRTSRVHNEKITETLPIDAVINNNVINVSYWSP